MKSPQRFHRQGGYLNVVEYLIERGANVNQEDDYERTPLWAASQVRI